MSAYDELQDLYNFDDAETITLNPIKSTYTIDGEHFNGYTVEYKGSTYFTHRLKSVDGSNRTMGNLWSVYSIAEEKVFISGCKTKKQSLEELTLKLGGIK